MNRTRRPGFSLLEVMLATTVLLGSVIVLSHIAFVGRAHMDSARQYSAAQLVCQARMNEMLAGVRPIEEVSGQRIAELPGWGLSVKVRSADQPGLLAIEVTAAEGQRNRSAEVLDTTSDAGMEEPADVEEPIVDTQEEPVVDSQAEPVVDTQEGVATGKQFTLVRWIVEPEGSELSMTAAVNEATPPVDVPTESSFFDDSAVPGESIFPNDSMPEGDSFLPDQPPLPEEPSMFEEPLPEL